MEFVQNYKIPLSSDGFSNFGSIDAEIHNQEIEEAHQYLLSTVIVNYAKKLESEKTFDLSSLKTDLHDNGINFRYLGKIRSLISDNQKLSTNLLIECIARVCKSHLKE